MKILVGGMNYSVHQPMLTSLERLCDVKCLDVDNADISYDPSKDTIHTALRKLSTDWKPDIILWWVPEYNTVISKIEESPYPIAVIVMDWNLGLTALKENLKRFDWIFIDKPGVKLLKKAGYSNVSYWKVASFIDSLYKFYPEIEKDIDVLFIGHFNHSVHRERSKWLKRLALLSKRYKIAILTGIYSVENGKMLNRAKICFNFSVRGEANLRTFEASACKTFLMIEETNQEVRDFFNDKEDCVFYNESNFENLIEYYLKNYSEREQIAESAYIKVQKQSYYYHFKELVNFIKENNLTTLKEFNRPFKNIDKTDKLFETCLLSIQGISKGSQEASVKASQKLAKVASRAPNSWNTLGVSYASLITTNSYDRQLTENILFNAIEAFNRATGIDPEAVLPYFNRASLFLLAGNQELAEHDLLKAFELLDSEKASFSCRDLFFPRLYDLFRASWEKNTAEFIDDTDARNDGYIKILKWKVSETLGDLSQNKGNLKDSLNWYNISVDSVAEIADIIRVKRGLLLYKSGKTEEAILDFKTAYQQFPFDTLVWQNLVTILYETNQTDECRKYCREIKLMIKSCPFYENELKWLSPIIEKISQF